MKIFKVTSFLLIGLAMMSSCAQKAPAKKTLKTQLDSVSYAIGLNMGSQIKSGFKEANIDLYIEGLKNGLDSTNILLDLESAQKVVQNYFQKKQMEEAKKKEEEALKKAEKEYGHLKVEGQKFLEQNKTAEGVKVTPTGLQYIVLKEGKGPKPTPSSKVKVHYHGTLMDGTVFDSSVDRGEPVEFGVTQVIAGWTEGLQLMSQGSKYKFFIPQELAYGATPRGGTIKPFSLLIFEVELLEVSEQQ